MESNYFDISWSVHENDMQCSATSICPKSNKTAPTLRHLIIKARVQPLCETTPTNVWTGLYGYYNLMSY